MADGPLAAFDKEQSRSAAKETKARIGKARTLLKPHLAKLDAAVGPDKTKRKELAALTEAAARVGPPRSADPTIAELQTAFDAAGLGTAKARKQLLSALGIREEEWVPNGFLAGERGLHTVTELPFGETEPKKQ